MKWIVKEPYRYDDKPARTLGYVTAASEVAARKKWERLHPDDEVGRVEQAQPRIPCRCPVCHWTFKGSRLTGIRALDEVDGVVDGVKTEKCVLCRAKDDLEWKARIFLKQQDRVKELEQKRLEEQGRRAERLAAQKAKEARRRPSAAELRRERLAAENPGGELCVCRHARHAHKYVQGISSGACTRIDAGCRCQRFVKLLDVRES